MLEKRLKSTEGGNCIIANLKAQLGRAKKELEEMAERFKSLKRSESSGASSAPFANKAVKAKGEDHRHQVQETLAETTEVEDEEETEDIQDGSEALEGERKANYQTQSARANYLCLDRPDIPFATKECMRRLSSPSAADEGALKKLGRYLKGKPRVVSMFEYGSEPYGLIVEGDSDHAGCARTRKST